MCRKLAAKPICIYITLFVVVNPTRSTEQDGYLPSRAATS